MMESTELPEKAPSSSVEVTPTSAIMSADSNVAGGSTSTAPSTPQEASPIAEPIADTAKLKRKRNRTVLSCEPCHRRKQQCDRGHPCSRCVSRGAAKACSYQEPKKNARKAEDSDDGTTSTIPPISVLPTIPTIEVNDRVLDLQRLITQTLNSLDPTAVAGLDSLLQSFIQRYPLPAPGGSSDFATPNNTGIPDDAVQVAAAALGQLSELSEDSVSVNVETFAAFDRDLFSGGQSRSLPVTTSTSLFDLWNNFPCDKIMSFLVSHYFDHSSVHWIWPAINRPSFEHCFRTFQTGAPFPPSIEFSALVAIICALSLQFLPESEKDAELFADYGAGRHVLEQKLLVFVRSVMLTAADPPVSSIERIQMVLLYAIYQWNDCKIGESYYILSMATRMAQTLGMHRDGLTCWHMRPREAEVRRRVWWCLFIADRFQAFQFGCPYIISDVHNDVEYPLNLDQDQLLDTSPLIAKPLEEPTDSLYLNFQSRLSQLIGRVCDECFGAQIPSYHTVMDLEEKLRAFDWDVPNSLRYQSSQVVAARPYLPFQYGFLNLEIYFTRVTLLRPFIFIRPEDSAGTDDVATKLNTFHRHARTVCLMLCKRLVSMAYIFGTQLPRLQQRWWAISGAAVHASLVFTVAILSDPGNPENEELSEWIYFADQYLKELAPYNVVAQTSLRYMVVMRNRTRLAMDAASSRTGTPCPCIPLTPAQNNERATRALSQPQPEIADLLGRKLAADPFWMVLKPGVFSCHVPGIACVSGPTEPQHLERFFDTCFTITTQTSLPSQL